MGRHIRLHTIEHHIASQMGDADITLDALARAYQDRCALCGMLVAPDEGSIDHIQSLSQGGLHKWANVQYAHRRCNNQKEGIACALDKHIGLLTSGRAWSASAHGTVLSLAALLSPDYARLSGCRIKRSVFGVLPAWRARPDDLSDTLWDWLRPIPIYRAAPCNDSPHGPTSLLEAMTVGR